MWSQLGNQKFTVSYVDRLAYTPIKNALAMDVYSVANNSTSSDAIAAGLFYHNHLDDPLIINQMMVDAAAMQTTAGLAEGVGIHQLRVMRLNSRISTRVTNLHTSPVQVWEYRFKARRDLPHGTSLYSLFSVPDPTYAQGLFGTNNNIAPIVSGSAFSTQLGVTPFNYHKAMTWLKCTKVRKWLLNPSKAKRITYSYKKPRLFSSTRLTQAAGGTPQNNIPDLYQILKGQSVSIYVFRGTVATDDSADENFRVGITGVNVSFETTQQYSWVVGQQTAAVSGSLPAVPGMQDESASVPLQIFSVVPSGAVSTGPVPPAAGTFVRSVVDEYAAVAEAFDA